MSKVEFYRENNNRPNLPILNSIVLPDKCALAFLAAVCADESKDFRAIDFSRN